MIAEQIHPWLSIVLLVIFLFVACLFFFAEQKLLHSIREENRTIRPGQVWLQLIPLYGLVWQFVVVARISDSINKELAAQQEDESILGATVNEAQRPLYTIGVWYCILICIGMLPLGALKGLFPIPAMICWIIFWTRLERYRKRIQEKQPAH